MLPIFLHAHTVSYKRQNILQNMNLDKVQICSGFPHDEIWFSFKNRSWNDVTNFSLPHSSRSSILFHDVLGLENWLVKLYWTSLTRALLWWCYKKPLINKCYKTNFSLFHQFVQGIKQFRMGCDCVEQFTVLYGKNWYIEFTKCIVDWGRNAQNFLMQIRKIFRNFKMHLWNNSK